MMQPEPPPAREPLFRRAGEYWTIAYDGIVCRVPDAKGVRLLATLLGRPGEAVAANRLIEVVGTKRVASADPMDTPEDKERARVNVTRAIRGAVRGIAAQHPALGAHFKETVRTGAACAYCPDPQMPIFWKL